jgi:hypothetical protein
MTTMPRHLLRKRSRQGSGKQVDWKLVLLMARDAPEDHGAKNCLGGSSSLEFCSEIQVFQEEDLMRSRRRLSASALFFLFCLPATVAQTNPPPADPHELVTRDPHILSKPADRTDALELLDRARKNFELRDARVPYALKVSFVSNGETQSEGTGTMEEFSDGTSRWRWTADLQQTHIVRIGVDNKVYGGNEPVPLRIQMVRSLLLRPVVHDAGKFEIRSADVKHDGKPLACLLLSYSLPPNPAPRAWVEREDCIDPATGLLQMWSEAPGIYAVYDYSGAADFHGHLLPHQISVFEEGRLTLEIHVESLADASSIDPSLLQPTPEMTEAGEAFNLTAAGRYGPLRVDPTDAPTSRFYQPVIVHAILDAQDGSVLDAEALQDSNDELGRAAVDLVRNTAFDASGFQQELFIGVHFHLPATRFGGPPLAIYRSRIHWVVLDHRMRPPTVHRLPHPGK